MMKNILTVLLVLFILGQFIRPTHNISAEQSPNDIERHYQVPTDVRLTLEKACRDCHSNNTRYPWYYNIQPVAWWLNDHIVEGKKHFNLSEFAAYPPKKADHKLEELIESQTDHWMPLESYQKLHADARLTEAESQALIDWASAVRDKIQTTHPEAFVKSRENMRN